LTNTQLKSEPYKHPQIRLVLLSLTSHSHIREVDPTTKRLVERCLNADWGDGAGHGTVVTGLRHAPGTAENEPLSLEANHGHMIVPENIKGMSIDQPVEEKPPKMKRGQSLLRKLGRSQRRVCRARAVHEREGTDRSPWVVTVRKICQNYINRI